MWLCGGPGRGGGAARPLQSGVGPAGGCSDEGLPGGKCRDVPLLQRGATAACRAARRPAIFHVST
jgi:hypothetical protein